MNVKISTVKINEKSMIKVESPYHPSFPKHAKNLGGKWNSTKRIWYFDPRDEDSVRDLCRDCFGTDGEALPELVDCQVRLTGSQGHAIWFAGREVAQRGARDWPVKLGDGVVVKEGEFSSRGGSRKYPVITFIGDSIMLEVRDVPASLAQKEKEDDPENVTILSEISEQPMTVTLDSEAVKTLKLLRDELSITDKEIIANALEVYYQERKKKNVN